MFFIKILAISLLSFLLTMLLPWYTVAIVAFLVGFLLSNKPGNNFLAGFLGVGLFWLAYILFLDIRNHHILSNSIARLFAENSGKDISTTLLIIVTTILGALIGGLASMSGAMIMDDGSRKRLRKALKGGRYRLKI